MKGRVFQTMGKQHVVWDGNRAIRAFPGGRLAIRGEGGRNRVAVGDIVDLKVDVRGDYLIEAVAPRRNKISRRISHSGVEQVVAANLDLVAIVLSPRPFVNTGLLDRYLVEAHASDIEPLIVLNKVDLFPGGSFPELQPYQALSYPVYLISARFGDGVDEFVDYISGHWTVLVGHSGVGKTTVVNRIAPGSTEAVGDVSIKTGRGRHTTSSAIAHQLDGNTVIVDTAGIREFGLWGIDWRCVEGGFLEIHQVAGDCHYPDCRHLNEPECAVRKAAGRGSISRARYDSYRNLLEEIGERG